MLSSWITRTNETYAVSETRTESRNSREYTASVYQCSSDTNPYSRGVSAFSVFENNAVSVELNCLEEYTGDAAAILTEFLSGFRYSADIGA